jgi:RNA polymerase sigma-70 factor (ECF subfamily)
MRDVAEGNGLEPRADAELVVLSQGGDAEAFNELARHWQGALYRFARRLLGDGEEARDVCQTALLRAYQNLDRLRDPAKFKPWVHLIALNLCRDHRRSPRARLETEPFEESEWGATPGTAGPERALDRARLAETLDAVLARVSSEQRTAILLREYQGFTTEEIAEMTGVPAATVRTRIFYGLKAVRGMLRERGIDSADLGTRS